jgi:hypothetical protein
VTFSLRDWFPCDLARADSEGKMMYIGVYTDHIVFKNGQFPARMTQIAFIFRFKVQDYEANSPVRFRLIDPNGAVMQTIEGALPPQLAGDRLNLQLGMAGVSFPTPGRYKIELSLGTEYRMEDSLKVTGPDEKVDVAQLPSGEPAERSAIPDDRDDLTA